MASKLDNHATFIFKCYFWTWKIKLYWHHWFKFKNIDPCITCRAVLSMDSLRFWEFWGFAGFWEFFKIEGFMGLGVLKSCGVFEGSDGLDSFESITKIAQK